MFRVQGQGLVQGGPGFFQVHSFHLGNGQVAIAHRVLGGDPDGLAETVGGSLGVAFLHLGVAQFDPGPEQVRSQPGGAFGQFPGHRVFPQVGAEGGEGRVVARFFRVAVEGRRIGVHRVGELSQQDEAAGDAAPGAVVGRCQTDGSIQVPLGSGGIAHADTCQSSLYAGINAIRGCVQNGLPESQGLPWRCWSPRSTARL